MSGYHWISPDNCIVQGSVLLAFAIPSVSSGPETFALTWVLGEFRISSSRYAWKVVMHNTAKQSQRAICMHAEVRGVLWWRSNHLSPLVCSVYDQIERSQRLISMQPGKECMAAVWNVKQAPISQSTSLSWLQASRHSALEPWPSSLPYGILAGWPET